MKIVYFGTPDYSADVVDLLHKAFKSRSGESPITAVVTSRPKPTGRKQLLHYSAVDNWAHKKKIPIFFDPNEILKHNIRADIGILASFGAIIPQKVIDHFPYGILNIHPSLLPKFRGASPVQATIVEGEQAGATIIKIDDQMDHGPILSQFKEDVSDEDTTGTLRNRLFKRSAEVLATLIPAYMKGKVHLKQQYHKGATYTKMVKKEDGFIDSQELHKAIEGKASETNWPIPFIKDFTNYYSPNTVHRFIRAMQPWPQAWTYIQLQHRTSNKEQRRLKILKAHLDSTTSHQAQHTKHKLILDEVQLESKNPVSWLQFTQGYPDAIFE